MSSAETNAQPQVKLSKKAVFFVGDRRFETQKEANEFLRDHLVVEAIKGVVSGYTGSSTEDLTKFVSENREALRKAFDAAKVERPPMKEETKQLMKTIREMTPEQRAQYKAERDARLAAAKEAKKAAKASKEAGQTA